MSTMRQQGASIVPAMTSEFSDKTQAQRSAEAEVAAVGRDLGPFVTAVETTRMAMVFTDARLPGHPIIFANDSFLRLTGYDWSEVVGQGFSFLMARGTKPEALVQIEAAFQGDGSEAPEVVYCRKDGSTFWTGIEISPVHDREGEVVQHFASFIDLTKHKLEQTQAQLLIAELNHRVKNTLSTVQSIVRQALRNDSDVEIVRHSIEARLFALARSHDLLTRGQWQGAGILDLVNEAMNSFGAAGAQAGRFTITGTNLLLTPNAALAFGIALHELATNAVKFGALSNEAGAILIGWVVEPRPGGDHLVFRWQEVDGPPVIPPSRRGFGSRVIERGLATELSGLVQLDFAPTGVVCIIDIPVPIFRN